jgi:hypothetical protein
MLRIHKIIPAVVLGITLSGCGASSSSGFDPSELLDLEFFKKPPLPGERKAVFPEGVPGVPQGVPKELVKGNQPPPIEEAAVTPAEPPPEAKPARPARPQATRPPPKPRTASAPPRQAPAQQPAAPQPASQPAASPWPDPKPVQAAPAKPPSPAWPEPNAQANWPPPNPNSFSR